MKLKRYNKPCFTQWGSLKILTAYMLLVVMVFGSIQYGLKNKVLADERQSQIQRLEQEKTEALIQKQQAETVARISQATSKGVKLNESQIRTIVAVVIPEKKNQDRFMRVLNCENGTHEPKKTNFNTDGSYDLGIAQINTVHKTRVEKLFGEDFDSAMSDPVKNLVFAAVKFQEEKFRPWVCNSLI